MTFKPGVRVPSITLSGGTTNVNGSASTPGLTQTGGTLGGSGTRTLTGTGNTWSGGSNGVWTDGGTVVVADGATLTLSGEFYGNVFAGRPLQIDAGASVTVSGPTAVDPCTHAILPASNRTLFRSAISPAYSHYRQV